MKYVYFDCFSGASGDMILGALLSLGVNPEEFNQAISSLKLTVKIKVKKEQSGGLSGLRVQVETATGSPARNFREVKKVIEISRLPVRVKEKALLIFKRLFEAEARVHGQPFDRVHLHEAAADDALVDIVGCCWLLDRLKVSSVYFSPVNTGQGFVRTTHGFLPVPPPAVAELMTGFVIYHTEENTELLTPTGAAILTTLGQQWIDRPQLKYEKIGYGLGQRQLQSQPNVLRVFYGEEKEVNSLPPVMLVEANLDDSSPQILGHFLNHALELGALEAYITPVVMKKNRPGHKLTLLAEIDKIDRLIEEVFKETSTIGVRYFPVERQILRREIRQIKIKGCPIGVKVSYAGQRVINIQPEYEDCLQAARKLGQPVKRIMALALGKADKWWEK
ncbi:MAG: nickel pincer cofactor biosynthesis protein LarC [Candidatus Aminicenantes bacterium]|nr:nickel pincer cofactor biosynthesis protein LarC [Candidatus Aminicenantes bacterium]